MLFNSINTVHHLFVALCVHAMLYVQCDHLVFDPATAQWSCAAEANVKLVVILCYE